jgi:hypothetical protein
MTCRKATVDLTGKPLMHPIPFSCECVSRSLSCQDACRAAFPDESSGQHCEVNTDLGAWLCGCGG